jgi:hypothetical protein
MATSTNPAHIETLVENASEVIGLIDLHVAITGSKSGRRHGVEILNKSALVLLVACWESFVEDVVAVAFDFLLNEAKSPDTFPTSVLALSTRALKEDPDQRKIWGLAGDGWRTVLQGHKTAVLKEYAGKLNTPRPKQVCDLIEKMIGLKNISNQWQWTGMPAQRACDKLDRVVTMRGEIAHRVRAGRYVRKDYVVDTAIFIQRLAAVTSNRIATHIQSRVGKTPWDYMEFQGTG